MKQLDVHLAAESSGSDWEGEMGNDSSKYAEEGLNVAYTAAKTQVGRVKAITANKALQGKLDVKLPPKATRTDPADHELIKVGRRCTVLGERGGWV